MPETPRPPLRRVAVLIPTYDERDTLPVLVRRLREVVPELDLVVLDDNSPDGTGEVADTLAAGGAVRAFAAPGCGGFSRRQTDDLTDLAVRHGAGGLIHLAVEADGSLKGPVARHLSPPMSDELIRLTGANPGDLILAVADADAGPVHEKLTQLLGRLRFRTSYSQNVLNHSLEVCHLAGMMAGEVGLDPRLARRCALLHDIGKIGVDKGSRRRRSGNTSRTRRRRATNPDFRCAN